MLGAGREGRRKEGREWKKSGRGLERKEGTQKAEAGLQLPASGGRGGGGKLHLRQGESTGVRMVSTSLPSFIGKLQNESLLKFFTDFPLPFSEVSNER